MAWADLHTAPRDKPIWLYVPAYKWKTGPGGQATSVENAARVACWDKNRGAWVDRETGHPVYPSLWSDADASGPMPDNPLLAMSA